MSGLGWAAEDSFRPCKGIPDESNRETCVSGWRVGIRAQWGDPACPRPSRPRLRDAARFSVDENKANQSGEDGVSFDEATTVFRRHFADNNARAHSQVEDRLIVLGQSHQRKLLVVVHTGTG